MSSSEISTTMMAIFCQTCSSEQTPLTLKHAFITPCCSSPICARCVGLNPRLREYVPCLKCGDPRTSVLRGGSSSSSQMPNGSQRHAYVDGRMGRNVVGGGDVMFEIGDDDDDDDDDAVALADEQCSTDTDGPPKYEEIHSSHDRNPATSPPPHNRAASLSRLGSDLDSIAGPAQKRNSTDTGTATSSLNSHVQPDRQERSPDRSVIDQVDRKPDDRNEDGAEKEEEREKETVEVRHTVLRSDNLLAIARKYAADPHDLLSLNNLPPTTLSTNPRLLHTRKSIIISRRHVHVQAKPGCQPQSANDDLPAQLSGEDMVVDEARGKEKSLKRFQLITKSTDRGVGETYLSLAELEEDLGSIAIGIEGKEGGEKKLEHSKTKETDAASLEKENEKIGPNGKLQSRGGAIQGQGQDERETRALEAFFDDEQWENAVGASVLESYRSRQGRWNVVGVGASAIANLGEGSGSGSGSQGRRAAGSGGGGLWSVFGKVR
ncbi:hypothetical protein IAU59_003493 [Kwoniella sp. CBS 9459]